MECWFIYCTIVYPTNCDGLNHRRLPGGGPTGRGTNGDTAKSGAGDRWVSCERKGCYLNEQNRGTVRNQPDIKQWDT